MKMLISHAHGRPASTTTTNTIYSVWAKRGREKLKLKYEASTWQVRLMPNGTLHTKQKTLDKFLTEAKSFPNIMCSPDFRMQARILWPETLQLPPSRQGGLRRGVAQKVIIICMHMSYVPTSPFTTSLGHEHEPQPLARFHLTFCPNGFPALTAPV